MIKHKSDDEKYNIGRLRGLVSVPLLHCGIRTTTIDASSSLPARYFVCSTTIYLLAIYLPGYITKRFVCMFAKNSCYENYFKVSDDIR